MRAVLIGGSSHVGKSTFAKTLSSKTGWQHLSTDSLARHPGRPWGGDIPDDVQEYYLSDPSVDLVDDVLRHYRNNVWPIARAIVQARVANSYDACIVLEGSAVLPDCVADASLERVLPVWFTATDEVITRRIHGSSHYAEQSSLNRRMIDRFVDRSLGHNSLLLEALKGSAFRRIHVTDDFHTKPILEEFVELLENS